MSTMLVLAERNVPRYTSYPTAPHFTAIVGPQTCAAWLAELPPAATLSLYLHVPYCTELCLYCGCTTKAMRRRAPVETYAEHLLKEIELLGSAIGGRRVTNLHWGGGTPSILGPDSLRDLTERIAGIFDLTAIAEHAIELDPRRVTPKLAAALGSIGVTRVSLGAGFFASCAGGDRPHPAVWRGRGGDRDGAGGWCHQHQYRPDVRVTAADSRRRHSQRRDGGIA